MKYINFKRYKFSTIFKNINFIRFFKDIDLRRYIRFFKDIDLRRYIRFFKDIDLRRYRFYKIYRFTDFRKYNLSRIINYFDPRNYKFSRNFKFFDLRKYNFSRIISYFDPRKYKFYKIYKYFNIKRYKSFFWYATGFIFLSGFIYLSIPVFFNYNKLKYENIVCKDLNLKCTIEGKINYSFIPSPRIKFSNFIVKDLSQKKIILANIEKAAIKISFSNLFSKEKFNYTNIVINKAEINLNLEKISEYKKIYSKKLNLKSIRLKKGTINFFEDKKYITNITDIKFNHILSKNSSKTILKGKFLNDKIYFKLKNKKNDKKISANIILKLIDTKLLTKISIFNLPSKTDSISGNILLKKDKNRLSSTFIYKDKQLVFKQANLRNPLLDGKFNGKVDFFPYFNFDFSVDLDAINFNKFRNLLVNLDDKSKKKLFKINKKINGQLSLSADKIYSKYNLIKSFESRIKFTNGNISVEQFLFNLGKLGAADLLGIIKNDNKFSNFKFENNIFIDNQKYFFSKFGIYNKENISSNLFISGNVDLVNLNMHFYEISQSENKKFTQEDINYVEKEFNDLLFEDGYASFFNFLKLKEYIKSMMAETN